MTYPKDALDCSIIIPTNNRSAALGRTISSLSELDHSTGSFEILIVDNGSTDPTRQVVEQAAAKYAEQTIRYFYEAMPGLLSGRHRGAMEAQGEICIFLDDDVRVSRDWLSAMQDAFRDPKVALAGGPSRPIFETEPPRWLERFFSETAEGRHCSWLSLLEGGNEVKQINPCYVMGLNFAIRKRALFDLGGFHPDCIPKPLQRFQGDGETSLSLKIRGADLKAVYHPCAAVQHEVPAPRLTIEYFQQRAFYQGVCDSYTQIRRTGVARPAEPMTWKTPLRPFYHWLKDKLTHRTSEGIRHLMAKSHQAGVQFHQAEVRKDPKLLEWVLKLDYFDYRLPEGWEHYLNS